MAQNNSLVKQLQIDAVDESVSVSSLLRKAKISATKLNLNEHLDWIDKEMNGYESMDKKDLPSYRRVRGELKFWNPYHGWCPIVLEDDKVDWLKEAPIRQSIASLESIISESKGELCISQYRMRSNLIGLKTLVSLRVALRFTSRARLSQIY